MTIEIRQMVIKSSVGGDEKVSEKPAGKKSSSSNDCACEDGCEGDAGTQERQKMRTAIAKEWERMRER